MITKTTKEDLQPKLETIGGKYVHLTESLRDALNGLEVHQAIEIEGDDYPSPSHTMRQSIRTYMQNHIDAQAKVSVRAIPGRKLAVIREA